MKRVHTPIVAAVSIVLMTVLCSAPAARAQTVAPAAGPDGRSPGRAAAPADRATSPGSSTGVVEPVAPESSPAPEDRATSPGTRAAPRALPTPTLGVPARVVAPGTTESLPDPVDPTTAVAPSGPASSVRLVPAVPAVVPAPVIATPGATPAVPAGPVVLTPSGAPTAPAVTR